MDRKRFSIELCVSATLGRTDRIVDGERKKKLVKEYSGVGCRRPRKRRRRRRKKRRRRKITTICILYQITREGGSKRGG